MNKKMAGFIVGGLLGISALGVSFSPNLTNAAEKNTMQGMVMEKGQMDHMDMKNMDMKNMDPAEMQKHCLEMMKSPQMQQSMSTMMKNPEMQAMMKQMLTRDPALRQTMLDLINSIDPNDSANAPDTTQTTMPAEMDHMMHH